MSAPIGVIPVSSTNANHALILETLSGQDVKADLVSWAIGYNIFSRNPRSHHVMVNQLMKFSSEARKDVITSQLCVYWRIKVAKHRKLTFL